MKSCNLGKRVMQFLLLLAACVMMVSCSGFFEYEGDCRVRYLVRFKYDYNMKFADAFRPEVDEVTLYLIDSDGNIVWQKTETGEALKAKDYAMNVDVAPGTYSMVAWCSSASPETFESGFDGTRESLYTRFHTDSSEDGSLNISHKLDRLYHGYMPDVVFPDAIEGDFEYLIPLTKNTNHFVVTLQQLSGDPIDSELVEFEITDDNIHLNWDNQPLAGNTTTYHQWYKTSVNADLSYESRGENSGNNRFAGVIAELTTSRLMKNSNARMRVYRTDNGETIASIRLIDALLLAMGYENSRRLTVQQYLDYKDEYNMIFFLDANHKWVDNLLQIESWHVVYKEVELNWE